MDNQSQNIEPDAPIGAADQFRKDGKYNNALEIYLVHWNSSKLLRSGWGSVHCLRKLSRLDEAEKIALESLERYPNEIWLKRELVWVLYDKEIKPAKENSDLGKLLYHAKRIFQLDPEEMPSNLIAKAIIKVAKMKGKWDVVLQWLDKLDVSKLSAEDSFQNNKRVMSEREAWFISKSRSFFELGRYKDARSEAQNGLADFPESFFLKRLAALALAKDGNVSGGISELNNLLLHPRSDWYLKADLAELLYIENRKEDAYRMVCESLLDSRQGSEYKLGAFLLLVKLAIDLENWNVAVTHIKLSNCIRDQEGWKTEGELTSLEVNLSSALKQKDIECPQLPDDVRSLEKLCSQYWRDGIVKESDNYSGVIKPYPSDRYFAFIKPDQGGDDVFVWVRDLPPKCAGAGDRVKYILKKSFDKKKNKDTFIAAYVRCYK